MSAVGILRIKKLKGAGIVAVAARHNRREIQAELGSSASIDVARSSLNETLIGGPTAADVAIVAKTRMRDAGIVKTRKDAVLCLELVFSLAPDHQLDDRAYFAACATWAAGHFGGSDNILSVDIHRDESAPHCHVLIQPLINGRLSGSSLMGDRRKLAATQQQFFDEVAQRFGLSKPPARLAGAARHTAAAAVLERLRTLSDPVLHSLLWPAVHDAIQGDPGRYLAACGIAAPKPKPKRHKTSTQIFTSPGKGSVRPDDNPIGFAPRARGRSLCPVGFAAAQAAVAPQVLQPAAEHGFRADGAETVPKVEQYARTRESAATLDGDVGGIAANYARESDITRERDVDLDPAHFDPVTGEFVQPAGPPERATKAAAQAWVSKMLSR